MDLEHTTEQRVSREEAAARLRGLADELARQNEVSFLREGKRITVSVPDEVIFTFEVEIGGDESELEIELKW